MEEVKTNEQPRLSNGSWTPAMVVGLTGHPLSTALLMGSGLRNCGMILAEHDFHSMRAKMRIMILQARAFVETVVTCHEAVMSIHGCGRVI